MSNKLVFRKHALQRMFQRSIRVDDVRAVLSGGKSIIDYPDDTPNSSRLMLGWRGKRPIHVVVARDANEAILIVVTAYEPDPIQWDAEFKRKVL